jgi:hypothetical protein
MKILATVLLFGAVLTAAIPVAADGIFHPGVGKDFSGILLSDRFDSDKNADLRDSRSFLVANVFLSEFRDDKFRRDGVIDWNFFEHGSSVWSDWKDWSVDNQGRGWDQRGKKEDVGDTIVAEPGSLSLLLFGLAVVGFLAPRRTAWPKTV